MNRDESASIARWFDGYIRSFAEARGELPTVLRIKVEHSRRVADIMEGLARGMGLPEGEALAAQALGLLHDVGRFSQYAEFHTISDRDSINHGARGFEVLERLQPLRNCAPTDRARIAAGVRHHNERHVPERLVPDELFFVKLIRDADKLDIFRTLFEAWETGELSRCPELVMNVPMDGPPHPAAVADLRAGRTVAYAHIQSLADFFLVLLSWVYDLNFQASYRRLADWNAMEKVRGALPRDAGAQEAAASAIVFFRRQLEARKGRPGKRGGVRL